MVTKRKFNPKAKAKARKAHKGKKGSKKKSGSDWYTNDGLVGMYSGYAKDDAGSKRRRMGAIEREIDGQIDNDHGDVSSDESDGSNDQEQESSDEEETPAASAFAKLMQGLESSQKQLEPAERSVLRRVLSEQEGVDYAGSSSSEEEEEEEKGNKVDMEESLVADAVSSTAKESVQGKGKDKNKLGQSHSEDGSEEETDDKKDDLTGTRYAERFISVYNLNDEEALEALSEEGAHQEISRSKSKTSIDDERFSITSLKGIPGSTSGGKSIKFEPAPIDVEGGERAAVVLELKLRLAKRWLQYARRRDKICARRLGRENCRARNALGLTELQTGLFPTVQQYSDVVFTSQSLGNASELRELYVLHALNHVYKAIDQVAKSTQRIKVRKLLEQRRREASKVTSAIEGGTKDAAMLEQEERAMGEEISELEIRDQGFTRPRVLILVPNRLAGLRIVRSMLDLLPQNANIGNKSRFWEDFSEMDLDEDGNDLPEAQARVKAEKVTAAECYDEQYYEAGKHPSLAQERSKGRSARPADWHSVFSGNNDECFKIGVRVSGRKLVTLFSDFYHSDIIIATPVGLRMATNQLMGDGDAQDDDGDAEGDSSAESGDDHGEDDDEGLAELGLDAKRESQLSDQKKRKEDTDFLSSIEVCILDQADVLEMQNWQHVLDVMSAINRRPSELREDMDFERVRKYFLVDGLARRFRQTLVFAKQPSALLNALVVPRSTANLNVAGLQLWRPARFEGTLHDVVFESLSHKFVRIEADQEEQNAVVNDEEADARFRYFEKNVMRALKRRDTSHTLLLVPSFLDFVPVRNLLSRVATAQGESGPRSRGKPWRGMAKARKRLRNGDRVKYNVGADIPQALFACISEYTDFSDIARARGDFWRGRARILLITERFYFYNRFKIRGIQRAVFYAPPIHAGFYPELCNVIENSASDASTKSKGKGDSNATLVLFDQSDCVSLERLVGTSHAKQMLTSSKTVFDISSS